jgi:lipopolysaccharide/colanic/teichoic acid biosynthesis glycosyltransferase
MSEPAPGYSYLVLKWLAASLLGTVVGIVFSGCSRDVKRYSTVRSMAKVLEALLIKEAFMLAALLFKIVVLQMPSLAVLAILLDLLITGVALSFIRVSARLMSSASANIPERAARKTALVAGTSESSIRLADDVRKEGYDVVGLLSWDKSMEGRVIRDYVIYYCADDDDLNRLRWRLGGVDGVFFPRSEELVQPGEEIGEATQHIDGMSLMGHIVKRSFDIVLSGLLLVIFSPVIAVCAILVKHEDGGPALFKQQRIGMGGKPFNIYKFRSMRVDAERQGCPMLYSGEEDPRLTHIGKFLRNHHLDELPQLWNVFRGDMSFIGYRPERQYYIDQITACDARYRYLYQIRPGVTSYATLYNGYTDTMEKMLTRLGMDLYYLRNHSIWFDVKVLGLTFLSIVSGKKF